MNVSPETLFWLAPIGAVLGLAIAYWFYDAMIRAGAGNDKAQSIATATYDGAVAYLSQQNRAVGMCYFFGFLFFAFLAYVLKAQSAWTPIAFLFGGLFSLIAGYAGLIASAHANARTAEAAKQSLAAGMNMAVRGAAVIGFLAAGLALADISIWFKILSWAMSQTNDAGVFGPNSNYMVRFGIRDYVDLTSILLTFGIGASIHALFARAGGGVFAKATELGAELVAKNEAGAPQDDPRNPAVVAAQLGNNVSDVSALGTDLYESYLGAILAAAALGATAFRPETAAIKDAAQKASIESLQIAAIILPLVLAGAGVIASLFGVLSIRATEDATQKDLAGTVNRSLLISSAVLAAIAVFAVYAMMPDYFKLCGSIGVGLLVGIVIGWSTDYYTSTEFPPTQELATQASSGPNTVLLAGLTIGLGSTVGPTLIVVIVGMVLAFLFAGGYDPASGPINFAFARGLYGIALAAVGMLAPLSLVLTAGAYGPIADNAARCAEMTQAGPDVRKRTDALAFGATTAASSRGYAVVAATLSAVALLAAYVESIRSGLIRYADSTGDRFDKCVFPSSTQAVALDKAVVGDFMSYFDVTLLNPQVLGGLLLGAMLASLFASMMLKAVGLAAKALAAEVKRQFHDNPGLLKGDANAKANHAQCITAVTAGVQNEMVLPIVTALAAPILVGLLLGANGVMGLLAGALATGFVLAGFLTNTGGTWDNAKKYIEGGQCGGKGSDSHKAVVLSGSVGNSLKDASGPALTSLIKVMSLVSIVVAGLIVSYSPSIQGLLGFSPANTRLRDEFKNKYDTSGRQAGIFLPGDVGAASGTARTGGDEYYDNMEEDDPLLAPEQGLIPDDEEALLGDTGSGTEAIGSATVEPPAAGSGSGKASGDASAKPGVKPTSGGDGGFGGFDDTPKPAAGSGSGKASGKPADDGGFGGFDDTPKPAAGSGSGKASGKPADDGGFGGFDDTPKPAAGSGSGSPAAAGSGSAAAAGSGSGSASAAGSGSAAAPAATGSDQTTATGSGSGSASASGATAPVAPTTPPAAGGSGSGSAAAAGSGSAVTPTGSGSGTGSATPAGSGSAAAPANGSGSGSASPKVDADPF